MGKTLASSKPGYLRKVVAAGGFLNYEKAHRQALAKTFARVVFPRLPVDAMSHVVAFAFHTGAYRSTSNNKDTTAATATAP